MANTSGGAGTEYFHHDGMSHRAVWRLGSLSPQTWPSHLRTFACAGTLLPGCPSPLVCVWRPHPCVQAQRPQEAPKLQPACTAPQVPSHHGLGSSSTLGLQPLQDSGVADRFIFLRPHPCLLSSHPHPPPCPPTLVCCPPAPGFLLHRLWSVFRLLPFLS